ncbi:hypothetical protein UYSO10_4106 [Kosakonia radicincitans]|nr:hypothetical protein UYSO10_4106 [Kosakonia radicincitans]
MAKVVPRGTCRCDNHDRNKRAAKSETAFHRYMYLVLKKP